MPLRDRGAKNCSHGKYLFACRQRISTLAAGFFLSLSASSTGGYGFRAYINSATKLRISSSTEKSMA
jgi:hypothetical protein